MNSNFQNCVDRIIIEQNLWGDYLGGKDKQLTVYLKWNQPVNEFRYVPRYYEIALMIHGLIQIYGEKKIFEELRIEKLFKTMISEKPPSSGVPGK
jgi:hypothetical protein